MAPFHDNRTKQQFPQQQGLPKGAPPVPAVLPVQQPAQRPSASRVPPTAAARPGSVAPASATRPAPAPAPAPAQAPAQAAAGVARAQNEPVIPGAVLPQPITINMQPQPQPQMGLTDARIALLQQAAAGEGGKYPTIPKPEGGGMQDPKAVGKPKGDTSGNWQNAYEKGIAMGMSEEDAADYADSEVSKIAEGYIFAGSAETEMANDKAAGGGFPPKPATGIVSDEEFLASLGASDTAFSQNLAGQAEAMARAQAGRGIVNQGLIAEMKGKAYAAHQAEKGAALRDHWKMRNDAVQAELDRMHTEALQTQSLEATAEQAKLQKIFDKETEIRQMMIDGPDSIAMKYGADEWAAGQQAAFLVELAKIDTLPVDEQMAALFSLQGKIAVNSEGLVYYTGNMKTFDEHVEDKYGELGASGFAQMWTDIIYGARETGMSMRDYMLFIGMDPGTTDFS